MTHIQGPSSAARPNARVVMIVPNPVLNDNRVIKTAETLARAGLQVTVLGLKLGGDEEIIEKPGWSIRIVPFSNSAQLAANERARSPAGVDDHRAPPHVGPRAETAIHRDLKNERMLMDNRRREAAAEVGWAREGARKRRVQWVSNLQTRKDSAVEKLAARTNRLKAAARKVPRPVGRIVLTGSEFIRLQYRVARATQQWSARRPAPNSRKDEQRIRRQLQSDEDEYTQRRQLLLDELAVVQNQTPSAIPEEHQWREYLPTLHNYEAALGPVLDSLDVDVIHVHDFPLLGVGARAAGRALRKGSVVHLVYDAHEYVAGIRYPDPIRGRAWLSLEREYLHHADQVITVSEPIAKRIQSDYSLSREPTVVLNAPVHTDRTGRAPELRKLAGVPAEARVIVYSGNLKAKRNVTTVVRALPLMDDDVHFVVVCNRVTPYVDALLDLAHELEMADRVHLVPYVDGELVPEYLAAADLAIHPLATDSLNHQLALPNKIFEYLHAGLPELVSDNEVMASFVTEHGIGESFSATDPADLARQANLMLGDIERYRRTIRNRPDLVDRYSWSSQVPSLLGVYERLLETSFDLPLATAPAKDAASPRRSPSVVFLPTNTAGSPWAWAKALEARHVEVTTEVIERARNSPFRFESDRRFDRSEAGTSQFMLEVASTLLEKTHAIISGGESMFGSMPTLGFWDDLSLYEGAHISVALVFHGSDIRDPDRHAALMKYSPYNTNNLNSIDRGVVTKLRPILQKLTHQLQDFDGPVFVSTPDLMDYLPHALWLPTVIDLQFWQPTPTGIGERRPRVVMIPTNDVLKGANYADDVCGRLHDANVVEYLRLEGLSRPDLRAAMAQADIVIDGLVLGAYGRTALQAMASGRLAIANVERVIHRVEGLPIVHADPDSLESILLEIVEDPVRFRVIAEQGLPYVERYHDGSFSTARLASFLGLDPETSATPLRSSQPSAVA